MIMPKVGKGLGWFCCGFGFSCLDGSPGGGGGSSSWGCGSKVVTVFFGHLVVGVASWLGMGCS